MARRTSISWRRIGAPPRRWPGTFAPLGSRRGRGLCAGQLSAWIADVGERFDLVLADPPYGSAEALELLERFRRRPFAKQLWIEHDTRAGLADAADWTREYGDTRLSRFRSGTHISLPTP